MAITEAWDDVAPRTTRLYRSVAQKERSEVGEVNGAKTTSLILLNVLEYNLARAEKQY